MEHLESCYRARLVSNIILRASIERVKETKLNLFNGSAVCAFQEIHIDCRKLFTQSHTEVRKLRGCYCISLA